MPIGYNNNKQIVQGPGYLTIMYEMNHDVRVIPLDARPHVSPAIRSYMGVHAGTARLFRTGPQTRRGEKSRMFDARSENLPTVPCQNGFLYWHRLFPRGFGI